MTHRCLTALSLITAFVILSTSTPLFGQLTYPLRSSERGTGAVYVFTDTYSCFTANITLVTVSTLARERNVPVVVFLNGIDHDRGKEFANRELPNVGTVVFDELGAHLHLFDVASLPCLIVLGKTGRPYYRGIPGKASFNVDSLVGALNIVNNESYVDTLYFLKGIRKPRDQEEIFALDSAGSIGRSEGTSGLFDLRTGKTIIFNHGTRNISIIGSDGTIIENRKFTFANPSYVSSTPMLSGIEPGADTLVFWDTDLMSARVYLARYTTNGSFVDTIDLPIENNRISYRVAYTGYGSPIAIARRISDGYSPYLVDTGVAFLRSRPDSSWQRFGEFNPYFYDTTTADWAWSAHSFCGDGLATYQNFDSVIDVRSLTGQPMYQMKLKLSEELVSSIADVDNPTSHASVAASVATGLTKKLRTHNLFYDDRSNKLYLVLVVMREQMVSEPKSQFERQYQPVIVEFDPSTQQQTAAVQLPMNTTIHAVRAGLIFGVTQRNKVLHQYRLPVSALH